MRYNELLAEARKLGGFTVTPVSVQQNTADQQDVEETNDYFRRREREEGRIAGTIPPKKTVVKTSQPIGSRVADIGPGGKEYNVKTDAEWDKQKGVSEDSKPTKHRVGLTVTDPNHPMVSKRKETIQKTVRVTGEDREKAINAAIAHYRRKGYKVHDHNYIGPVQDMDEAIKLDAPQRRVSRDELQGYAGRIKSGTKTKQEKFAPIIHGSNIKAITTDSGEEWDLDDLAKQITTRPRAILGTNAKMEKSANEGEIVYDLTLPALSGIVVDEDNGDFVQITTCPGAGECQLFCYARKGGYVMFPASSMSAAQALNFLVNDPEGYMAKVNQEINQIKGKTDKRGIQLVVRWHDAGDFFSKEYLDLAYKVANTNPDVKFYAYTKMGDVATGGKPANFIINFSSGAKRGQDKKIEIHKAAGNTVKQGLTLPKDMFRGLFVTDPKGKYVKDAAGRTQIKGDAEWNQFKQNLAAKYKIDPATIITYDQMLKIPEGPTPKWNVIVFPAGHGDRAANRLDVENSFLMFH